jgi:glutamate dehydrogenase (NAD(P)+)
VGSWTARLAKEAGFRVVAISDSSAGVYNARGLDIDRLVQHRAEDGRLLDFVNGDRITNAELLALPCDVLIPAATGDVITETNHDSVRAKIIVEAANHPVTPKADAALADHGVLVVPDILANAGGVVVSYFEWAQNIQQFRWELERVNNELSRIMTDTHRQVRERATREGATLRRAAHLIAVERVAQAIRLRGFV